MRCQNKTADHKADIVSLILSCENLSNDFKYVSSQRLATGKLRMPTDKIKKVT